MKTTLRTFLTMGIAFLATGCRVMDLAAPHRDQSPRCEAHGTVMRAQIIHVDGESSYLPGYPAMAQKIFPHHGGLVLNGERYRRFEFGGRVRDFVCADCDDAHAAWWKKWKTQDKR